MEGSAGGSGGQMKGPSRRAFGPQQQQGGRPMVRGPPGAAAAAAHAHAQAHAQAQGMMGPAMGPRGPQQQVLGTILLAACFVHGFVVCWGVFWRLQREKERFVSCRESDVGFRARNCCLLVAAYVTNGDIGADS